MAKCLAAQVIAALVVSAISSPREHQRNRHSTCRNLRMASGDSPTKRDRHIQADQGYPSPTTALLRRQRGLRPQECGGARTYPRRTRFSANIEPFRFRLFDCREKRGMRTRRRALGESPPPVSDPTTPAPFAIQLCWICVTQEAARVNRSQNGKLSAVDTRQHV